MIAALLLAAVTQVAAQAEQYRPPFRLSGDTATPIREMSWISLSLDYPAGAIRAAMDGTVAVRLFVTGQGRVAGCLVRESDTYSALELATCRLLRSRARFVPFAGTRLATYDYRIHWDLAQAMPIRAPQSQPETLIPAVLSPAGR